MILGRTPLSKTLPPLQGELSQALEQLQHFPSSSPLPYITTGQPRCWWWRAQQQLLNMVGGETKLGHTHLVHAGWSARGTNKSPAGKKVWLPRNVLSLRNTHRATLIWKYASMLKKNKVVKRVVMNRKHSIHCQKFHVDTGIKVKASICLKSCRFAMFLKFSQSKKKKKLFTHSSLTVCHGRPGSTWKPRQCC